MMVQMTSEEFYQSILGNCDIIHWEKAFTNVTTSLTGQDMGYAPNLEDMERERVNKDGGIK